MSNEGTVRSRMRFSSGWSAAPLMAGCLVLAGCVVAQPPPAPMMPVNLAPPMAPYANYGAGSYPAPAAAMPLAPPADAGAAYAVPPPPPVAATPLDQSAGATPIMPDTPSTDQPGQNLLGTPDATAPGDAVSTSNGAGSIGPGAAPGSDGTGTAGPNVDAANNPSGATPSDDADTARRLQAIRDQLAHDQAAAPPTRYGGMSSAGDVAPLPPRSPPLLSP